LKPQKVWESLVEKFLDCFESHRQLKDQVFVDPLTGLGNRRAFFRAMEREMERVRRGMGKPLSIIVIDIDRFKSVNDEHGHAIGDKLLERFGSIIRKTLRLTDFGGRLGGEEFVIVMPGTRIEDAFAHAITLRKRVEELLLVTYESTDDEYVHVSRTASFGVATWNSDDEESHDSFMARADRALYRAKEAGRNRVMRAENPV
jgi:two-component system, cell cycle response regulator